MVFTIIKGQRNKEVKMKKRLLVVMMVVLAVALVFTGCGTPAADSSGGAEASAPAETSAEASTAASAEPAGGAPYKRWKTSGSM